MVEVGQFEMEIMPLSGSILDGRQHPYIWMHATNGAYGGLVGRVSSMQPDFCWMCHMHYLADGKIKSLAAAPEDAMVQAPGCLDPTFIGSQVDLTEVSLMGTRLVLDEVMTSVGAQKNSAYDWNVATLRLRDENGSPQLPQWIPYQLTRHESCPNH